MSDPSEPAAPREPDPGAEAPPPSGVERDLVTRLVARMLDNDDIDGGVAAHGALIELAYLGDQRAERAAEAIIAVEVERAEAEGTMPTPAQFDAIIARARAAAEFEREYGPPPTPGGEFRVDVSFVDDEQADVLARVLEDGPDQHRPGPLGP